MDAAGLERIVSESNREAEAALKDIADNSTEYKKNRRRNARNLVIAGLIGASIFASYRTIPYAAKKAIGFITEKAGSIADYLSEHPIYSIPGPELMKEESSATEEQTQQYEDKTPAENKSGISDAEKEAEATAAKKAAAEKKEAERIADEKAAAEKKAASDKIAAQKKEAERIAAEKKAAADKIAAQKKEAERIAAEKKAAAIAAEKKAVLDKATEKANFEKYLRTKFDDVFRIDSPSLQYYLPSMYKKCVSKTEWIQLYSVLSTSSVNVFTPTQSKSLATLFDGNLSNGEVSSYPWFCMPIDRSAVFIEFESPVGDYFAKVYMSNDNGNWDAYNKRCDLAKKILFGSD